MNVEDDTSEGCPETSRFATTRWSVVIEAGRGFTPAAQLALSTLCETYWYPLYAYVRRRGHRAEEARDLTQEFFAVLLEKEGLAVADRDRGKFRSFLLASLNHFLANEWRRAHAQKRGGRTTVLSLDFETGESRYGLEPSHDWTAEKLFERRWALTILERAMGRAKEEYAAKGKLQLFAVLKDNLSGEGGAAGYRTIAQSIGMSEGSVKVAAHRLRQRWRELLRAEIEQTVAEPDDVDEELLNLLGAIDP